jgi:glycosyltransferase involved in cell wall biosynthesis
LKILWLTNLPIAPITKELGIETRISEGWLLGLSKELVKHENISLIICCANNLNDNLIEGTTSGFQYILYPQELDNTLYDRRLNDIFVQILDKYKPDIVHIMGSEYPHTYSMISACEQIGFLDRTVVSIQGLISVCAGHYCLGLPAKVQYGHTLRDLLKRNNVEKNRKRFEYRGKYEKLALEKCKNVIGRTDWDRACTTQFNPNVNYYFNNETLRPAFYEKIWSLENCERYSIFINQATYPIKGFHFILMAMPQIIKKFPDAKLYVAGSGNIRSKINMPRWKRTKYENYIFDLIEKGNLMDSIVFCGSLQETEIRDRFLKSNVFVLPSTIENSPNSVGEAMILGVPVVTSDVGGVKNLLLHRKEGYAYQVDAPYMLAYYVCEIFSNDEIAKSISKAARNHALVTHDAAKNVYDLLEIYKRISCIE